MRILFALALIFASFGAAQAEQPERLTDRPVPALKLNAALGWRLSAVLRMDVEKGVEVLVIEGDVINISDKDRATPKIRLGLRDKDGREFFHWTVLADEAKIAAREYVPFAARLEKPPADMALLEIQTIENE